MAKAENTPTDETSPLAITPSQRPAAKAGHGDARDKASLVGEPLDQGGNRHNVAEADPDAAQEPVRQVEQRQAVPGKASEKDPGPVEHPTSEGPVSWPPTCSSTAHRKRPRTRRQKW